jgi:hypothetical protein
MEGRVPSWGWSSGGRNGRTSVDEAIPVRVDKIKRRRRQQGNDFLGPDFQHGVLF